MAIASIVPNFLMGIIIRAGIQVCIKLHPSKTMPSFPLNHHSKFNRLHHSFINFCLLFNSGSTKWLPHDIPKPVWRYPMSYISFHFWALQGQYQNDLRGLIFDNQTPELPKIPGEYILEKVFQIDVNRSKWINLSVIFSMIVIYRIIFFIMIKINEDVTPWVRGYMARRRMQQKSGAQNTTIAPDVLTQSPSLRTYVSPPTK
ncbi:ABC transporter G family member 11 [Vigna angularis]|uniref:ABC transporter G family member 11 n=1 Tax=Phaseolus angularis TaxID=3914 RepID=UPI0022B5CBB0|nr:ABC transporter G family member 11 [Vigna angularis]